MSECVTVCIIHVSQTALCVHICQSTEILAADKQLAEEIEFDLKRMEEEQKKAAAARAVYTPLPDTPHAQLVSK